MDLSDVTEQLQAVDPWIWAVVAAAATILVALLVALVARRRQRRQTLQHRYGSEYERTARQAGSRRRADQELLAREQRRDDYEVRELETGERERLRARWEALQASFVDGPETAVRGADDLIVEVAQAKGYGADAADPLGGAGVDHPLAVDRYRTAEAPRAGAGRDPDTEALRQTMLAARELFETLVGRELPDAPGGTSAFASLVAEDRGEGPAVGESPSPREDVPSDRARDEQAPRTGDEPATGPADRDRDLDRERTTDRDADLDRERTTDRGDAGSSGMPLYGPDGRPLDVERTPRRR